MSKKQWNKKKSNKYWIGFVVFCSNEGLLLFNDKGDDMKKKDVLCLCCVCLFVKKERKMKTKKSDEEKNNI